MTVELSEKDKETAKIIDGGMDERVIKGFNFANKLAKAEIKVLHRKILMLQALAILGFVSTAGLAGYIWFSR